jgi:hypothetical protein
LALVVGDEGVHRRQVDRRCNVDRVQRPQGRVGKRAGRRQEPAFEWEQGERVGQLAGALDQDLARQARIARHRPPDRARQLGEHQLARDEVGAGEKRSQRSAPGLVTHQLDERRCVG